LDSHSARVEGALNGGATGACASQLVAARFVCDMAQSGAMSTANARGISLLKVEGCKLQVKSAA
jgi:hypothetical protein